MNSDEIRNVKRLYSALLCVCVCVLKAFYMPTHDSYPDAFSGEFQKFVLLLSFLLFFILFLFLLVVLVR